MTSDRARAATRRRTETDRATLLGATAVAAIDILKAWGASLKGARLQIKFVCIAASEKAVAAISSAHADVSIHVGLIDRLHDEAGNQLIPLLPGMGDIGDRMFGTGASATPIDDEMDAE